MDLNYDESSQEVVTTIAMIKSMTTIARKRSSLAKSPMLPRINNVNEDAVQRTFLIQNVARRRLAIYQNRRPLIRGPREGYRNFSEHRVQAAPRKKQDQTLKFMKHSLIKQTALGLQITQTISPLRTSNPSKSFPTSRKIDYRKKKPSQKERWKRRKYPKLSYHCSLLWK